MTQPPKTIERMIQGVATDIANPAYVNWLEDLVKELRSFIYDLQKSFAKISSKTQADFFIQAPEKKPKAKAKQKHRPDLYDDILSRLVREHRRVWNSALKPFLPSALLKDMMVQALQLVGESGCMEAIRGQRVEAIKPDSKRGRELRHVFRPGPGSEDELDKEALALFIDACPKSSVKEMQEATYTKQDDEPKHTPTPEGLARMREIFNRPQKGG